jgi:hypothetical protein
MQFRTDDNPPRLQTHDTDFGVELGSIYDGAEGMDYWRFNLFFMPFYTAPPGYPRSQSYHAFVPLSGHLTARWTFTMRDDPISARERAATRKGCWLDFKVYPGTH